jgi:hypothetical protein
MDRILPDPGDHAEYSFPRQPSADGIRYPWGLNNILEQLTDVVGRAPAQAGSWMFTPTAAGIDTTIQVFETVLHEAHLKRIAKMRELGISSRS